MLNRLQDELSPYLRQHMSNPVDWYPWGQEAFTLAQSRDLPIFISIGYAACHWCHVMAHESFEDDEVAQFLNTHFISIKIDREERPDIDNFYMSALHSTGEQGGWPLSCFTDSIGSPIFAGTYYPKHSAYGRPGFLDILSSVKKAWEENRDGINNNSKILMDHLQQLNSPDIKSEIPEVNFPNFLESLLKIQDAEHGGIRGAPKFPNSPYLDCLWVGWSHYASENSKTAFLKTLEGLCCGGIYDHIGGGLSRYSVDDRWLVPHFEKMLYDNAHFIRHLGLAYRLTNNELYRLRLTECIDWLKSQMFLEGALCASLDADSDGEEGRYYIWQHSEVLDILGDECASFTQAYDITPSGNWEGKSIANLLHIPFTEVAEMVTTQRPNREKLLKARDNRNPPQRDDKILSEWNGYMIEALAEVGDCIDEALPLAESIFNSLCAVNMSAGDLIRCRGSHTPFYATAADRVAIANAALTLFEKTGNQHYLDFARDHTERLHLNHCDDKGSIYQTDKNHNDLPIRLLACSDDPNPSAASQFLRLAMRLNLLTGELKWYERAEKMAQFQQSYFSNRAFGDAGFMSSMEWLHHSQMVCLIGSSDKLSDWKSCLARNPHSARIVMVVTDPADLPHLARLNKSACEPASETITALVCRGQVCSVPITDIEVFEKELKL